jgi:formate hydrogenlyase transcriptional activator
MLVEISGIVSLEVVLERLKATFAAAPHIEFFRLWLLEAGDLCRRCPWRSRCPNQTRCLHAVGGGNGGGGVDYGFVDRNLSRIPIGLGGVGGVAATGRPSLHSGGASAMPEFAGLDPAGLARVRFANLAPVVFNGEVLGVMGIFVGETASPESRAVWLRVVAGHIGGLIVYSRAFREVERLKAQLELENANLKEEVDEAKAFGELVGRSAALRRTASQIDVVAPTDATVLITGESGTGKELVAREIHRRSRRRDRPLIRVNCASIPQELFESEFFGHARGAFTGAVRDRAGRFEAAEGGTLFLDEVGEIPIDLQSKLLSVLQERKYERVGEERTRNTDVRIVAATNRDLKRAIAAGRFREDLYYRLNVFPMEVAPLRERKEDIPLLTRHFVDAAVRTLGCRRPRVTPAALDRLQLYDWPGNLRELRNVIDRAVILARGGPLRFDQLEAAEPPQAAPARAAAAEKPYLTDAELERLERDNLVSALDVARWKIKGPGGAAELLGVNPTTLLSRMKKKKIRRPA